MATTDPQTQIQNDISSLQSRLNELHSKVQLVDIRDTIEDLQSKAGGLESRIKDLRSRNYVFEKNLETKAVEIGGNWNRMSSNLNLQLNQQSSNLQMALTPVENELRNLAGSSSNIPFARSRIPVLQTEFSNLESKVSAACSALSGMYDSFQNELNTFDKHLNDIDFMLTNLAKAIFQLLPTESGVMAVKAIWAKNGKEQKGDPEGILFLTDQRIVFEQREEVATKKVLFIATEKKLVQEKLFEFPFSSISEVKPHKAGLFKNEDNLDFSLANSFTDKVTLHIWQDCNDWVALINRVKNGEFDQDRVVAIDKEVIEKVKAAPTQCPECGGAITKPVLRGQDTIICDFCGAIIRL
jgi:hypothetical protein